MNWQVYCNWSCVSMKRITPNKGHIFLFVATDNWNLSLETACHTNHLDRTRQTIPHSDFPLHTYIYTYVQIDTYFHYIQWPFHIEARWWSTLQYPTAVIGRSVQFCCKSPVLWSWALHSVKDLNRIFYERVGKVCIFILQNNPSYNSFLVRPMWTIMGGQLLKSCQDRLAACM